MGGVGGEKNLAKKMLLALTLTPAETKTMVLLSASVERFGVSRMRDFYIENKFCDLNLF